MARVNVYLPDDLAAGAKRARLNVSAITQSSVGLSSRISVNDPRRVAPVVIMTREWHDRGMARARISTTVDKDLLDSARRAREGATDAELIDNALAALLACDRAVEIEAAYAAAYSEHPIDEPDEWGDLASFREAAGR